MRGIAGILAYAAIILIAVIMMVQEQIKLRKNKRRNQGEINWKSH